MSAPRTLTGLERAYRDPLGHVLATPREELPQSLVESVCQGLLRRVLHGALHEQRIGDWYREAVLVEGVPRAFHDVIPAVLERLQDGSASAARAFAEAPDERTLASWVARLYATCRGVLPPVEGPARAAPAPLGRVPCTLPRRVGRLAAEIARAQGLRLFLHGSLATCDATPYSDVDTLLFLDDRWLESAETVRRLQHVVRTAQRWLFREDPTQHHGFMLVTELDLSRYAPHYFPLELLGFAHPLVGGGDVVYRPRPAPFESRALLLGACERIEALGDDPRSVPSTRYALKSILSEMMLVPSYFLQVRGEVLYKRDSFGAVRPLLSAGAATAFDLLADWRRDWRLSAWDVLYRQAGEWISEWSAVRVLARVRACPVSAQDRKRWNALMPHARELARELVALAPPPER